MTAKTLISLLNRAKLVAAIFCIFGSGMISSGCADGRTDSAVLKACELEPDPGPCNAAFPRYYYDRQEQKCKVFTWGGCGGVVPFETLEACQDACE